MLVFEHVCLLPTDRLSIGWVIKWVITLGGGGWGGGHGGNCQIAIARPHSYKLLCYLKMTFPKANIAL